MSEHSTTVRFWTWHIEGYVRLTLREGEPLRWHSGGPDDEGFWWRGETWLLEDGVVYHDVETDGKDCDGRHSTSDRCACPVADLEGYFLDDEQQNPDKRHVPKWTSVRSGQRDYSAEAMGY